MNIALFFSGRIGLKLLIFLLQNHRIHLIVLKKSENELFNHLKNQFPEIMILLYDKYIVLNAFERLNIELVVVGCFHILPKEIWDYPKHGTINLHYSLLPSYRGPQPLEWQIYHQEKKFGLTIHQITDKIDIGPILYQKEFKMMKKPTVEKLVTFLITIGNNAIDKVIYAIQENSVKYVNSNYPSSYYSFFKT
jgi:methionyl-tRNA formyltransferase